MATSLISPKTGPITNSVRNSAIPVSTWLGGEDGNPRAFRVSARTTMILVNDVARSSTDGAIDSTVIARISVTAPPPPPPTLMLTVPSSTDGAVGAAGAEGSVGAAEATPGSASTATVQSAARTI